MNICELIKTNRIYFDGGMGTLLQKQGLKANELPELWNIYHPEIIEDIHYQYLKAGANIITTNTFGVNCLKHSNYAELIKAGILCAQKAIQRNGGGFIAFDIGPLGRFLEPIGELSFENAVETFAKNIKVAKECGADLIIIETMTDSYETKAAVIAAKENCDLPIFVTNVFDETQKTLTGSSPEVMVALLEGLGVNALGINCSLGPDKMIDLISRISSCSSLPVIANPNAGLPKIINGQTTYNMGAEEFSNYAINLANAGANILGGCCGTEPEYIRKTVEKTKDIPIHKITNKKLTVVSSSMNTVNFDKKPILIGERINPTGKPRFKEALLNNDYNYLLKVGLEQADAGVHILDVNVGLPNIDEVTVLRDTVRSLQSVCDLPLQLDSSDPAALESAMRIYNGKPMINSVNGDIDSMLKVFPLVKKYGGVVIALTLDKNGIPETSDERVQIALNILDKAKEYGIDQSDIIFDPLAMAISSNPQSALETLKTVEVLHNMNLKTSLGISNISFGLPSRAAINATFLAIALRSGLSCAIINPLSKELMDSYYSYCALSNLDKSCNCYINYALKTEHGIDTSFKNNELSLGEAIERGLIKIAEEKTSVLLESNDPIHLINNEIIPALNIVGEQFEHGKIFLPQLLNSAEAASSAFSRIKVRMPKINDNGNAVIIATVKGDIHDIGKNIVKLLLESYGFAVYDLGKNVPADDILEAVKKFNCKLVALSALMTTTIDAMKETIIKLKNYDDSVKIIVGGAVLNEEIAKKIGADFYGKDAMSAVKIANEYYK